MEGLTDRQDVVWGTEIDSSLALLAGEGSIQDTLKAIVVHL